MLATAAYLSGHTDECVEALSRAYHLHVEADDIPRAAACAYWLAFSLINRGDHAQVRGWVSRALRLLDDGDTDCVERGYLMTIASVETLMHGDVDGAMSALEDIVPIARRFQDANLLALLSLVRGQAMIVLGRTSEAIALLDEVMVAAMANQLSEAITGLAYCATIEACQNVFDVRRAREWTWALSRWCAEQPELVPYSGHCLVHRAEIYQLHGDWPQAALAVRDGPRTVRARRRLVLERLRLLPGGRADAAPRPPRLGRAGVPGGEPARPRPPARMDPAATRAGPVRATAASTSRRLVAEAGERFHRARMLRAHIDIMLAVDDVAEARRAADELTEICADGVAPMLEAIALRAHGGVCLAEGESAAALAPLRQAAAIWREIDAPYELARTRELVGVTLRDLDDNEGAALEFEASARAYEKLGAEPDLARVGARTGSGGGQRTVLTVRESSRCCDWSPRDARTARSPVELVLSEKTVARHISNIFVKLGLSSRAAATAYAYEHDLV